MGYVKGADGNVRPLTDQEAKSILAPDQYALFQAKQRDAQALSSGLLPDYVKREMDAQNNQVLGAANKRLGPGGYYTSTPGNQALNQVTQNVADTTMKNRANQVGLLSSYYGLGANIADQLPKYGQGLLSSGQSIAKNMIQPFHEWTNQSRIAYSQGLAGMAKTGLANYGEVGSAAMGMYKGKGK
jgi:hypothetical protein